MLRPGILGTGWSSWREAPDEGAVSDAFEAPELKGSWKEVRMAPCSSSKDRVKSPGEVIGEGTRHQAVPLQALLPALTTFSDRV